MEIQRNERPTATGPNEWFTGAVFIDPIAAPGGVSRLNAGIVHFAPGARTAWHTHPNGQTLWVTQGVGLVQRRRGPVEVIRPGDCVSIAPGEEHWYGATADRLMTHLSMVEVDDQGNAATWGDHVTDEEYGAVPQTGG
jgi:quercetin dioxygenase-like cupin family protein